MAVTCETQQLSQDQLFWYVVALLGANAVEVGLVRKVTVWLVLVAVLASTNMFSCGRRGERKGFRDIALAMVCAHRARESRKNAKDYTKRLEVGCTGCLLT